MGTELQLCKMNKFRELLPNKVVNTTVLNTFQMVKMVNFMLYVFYHNIENVGGLGVWVRFIRTARKAGQTSVGD